MNRELAAIVLAAGTSSRMGPVNKLLVARGNLPLVRVVCQQVVASDFDQVIVVLGHEHERIRAVLADLPVTTVVNPHYRDGMASSVAAGVAAATVTDGFLFALADMPEIRVATYRALRRAFSAAEPGSIVVPYHQGKRGNPVIFAERYREELASLTGDRGAKQLLQVYRERVKKVAVDDAGVLFDIDHPGQIEGG